ncbi:hypothetical protein [Chondrinema litorale]|uniref:hypothetical protein n=1 Tax=Chondrinema litorale TaxID=2994555 RepID=UPI0025427D72|nr:hypothetical protein [Chondrinema litorale]UZR96606.1 hypothetical protein OQ292_20880 [Chondrinema litorale]
MNPKAQLFTVFKLLFFGSLIFCIFSLQSIKPNAELNNGISGKFYFQLRGEPVLMDLKSGNYTFFNNKAWEKDESNPAMGIAKYYSKPFPKSDRILISIRDALNWPEKIGDNYSLTLIQDFEGKFFPGLKFKYDILSGAEVAPDEKHFALTRELDENWLEIYSFDNEYIDGKKISVNSFKWLPNGRLIYATDRQFVITQPYSTQQAQVIYLPSSVKTGKIKYISVNPNGKYLSFALVNDGTVTVSTYSTFWTLNLETNNFHQMATIHKDDLQTGFKYSSWSPDGKWLAVYQGGFGGSGPLNPGGMGQIYILPFDELQTYVVSKNDNNRSAGVGLLKRYHISPYGNERQRSNIKEDFYNAEFFWLE